MRGRVVRAWGIVGVRIASGLSLALGLAPAALAPPAAQAAPAEWRFEPALAPQPAPGVAPAPYSVPLGEVGQISFWAPNRGLLITGGTQSQGGIVPAGLYAYDGVSWHQLASVCGGAKGRIAWAGPDEFWTVSDQRAGQILGGTENQGDLEALSLCHFVWTPSTGAQVVGSYAMPLGEPGSYMEMSAAACLSSADCWFAGQDGQPPHLGSFHLHWNGSEVSATYDSSDHAVTGMVSYDNRIYEGLSIGSEDSYLPSEEPVHPPVMRTIAPAGQTPLCSGAPSSFCNVFLFSGGQPLPAYPERTLPDALGGFDLATDGGPLGSGATQLWAGADPLGKPPAGSGAAKLTILRNAQGTWTQIAPTPGGSPLPEGTTLGGSSTDVSATRRGEPGADAIAPEPGAAAAWLSLHGPPGGATVALLEAGAPQGGPSAVVLQIDQLPGPGDHVGFRGTAGPIDCPAAHDCWMATDRSGQASGGWLFHLTDGTQLPANTDPLFDGADGVIDYRPPDGGVPTVYPDGFAEDDSLANQQPQPPPPPPPESPAKPADVRRARPLVTHFHSAFVHGRVLTISFTLTARAYVRLVGRRGREVVAQTPRKALRAGRHRLSLALDPRRWPTKIAFQAKPIAPPALAPGSPEGSGPGDTLET